MTSVCVGCGCAVLPTEPIRYPSARSLSACADAATATPPPLSTTTSVSARVSCGAPTGVACCGWTAARATFSTAAARTWCATDLPTIVTPIATSATSSRAASAEATIVAVRHRETWREGAYVCSTGRTHSCRGLALLRSAARSSSRSWRPAGRASAEETVQLARPRKRSCGQRGEAAPEAGSAGREETPARDVRSHILHADVRDVRGDRRVGEDDAGRAACSRARGRRPGGGGDARARRHEARRAHP